MASTGQAWRPQAAVGPVPGVAGKSGLRAVAWWLVVAFVFAVPWENAIHVDNIGRISKVLGLATVCLWAISVAVRGRLRQPGAFQKAYFLFLIWNGLTVFWSLDPSTSARGFVTYTEIFGLLLILWDLCETETDVKTCLQAYVLGAYITCFSLLVTFFTAPPQRFPGHHRFQALGFETDGIALILAIAAPAAWYLAASPGSRRPPAVRMLNYAYVPIALFALILTGTRGATIASIPTVIFVLWSLRRARTGTRVIAWAALLAAIAVVVWVAPREQLSRIGTATTITESGGGALSGRLGIWNESIDAFLERPLTGAGLDGHRAAIPTGKEAHNTYVSVLAETGIVGFVLLANLIVAVVLQVRYRRGWNAWYWFAQISVVAIGAMSLSLEDSKSVWIFLSLAVASAAAAASKSRAAAEAKAHPSGPRRDRIAGEAR